jgi:hypothetical protein
MAVLMQHRVLENLALPRGDHDRRWARPARVTGGSVFATAEPRDLRLGNDPNRDVADLVSVCGRAQHARVPLRVDVRRANVERDLATLVVVRRDDRGIRAGCADKGKGRAKRDEHPAVHGRHGTTQS